VCALVAVLYIFAVAPIEDGVQQRRRQRKLRQGIRTPQPQEEVVRPRPIVRKLSPHDPPPAE
jgi:hypothetical protein